MANLKGMLVVGGLVAALGTAGCRKDSFENDVRSLALVEGWKDFNVQLVQKQAYVCDGVNLYSVEGINPSGNQATGYVCCGVEDSFLNWVHCEFTGGN